MKLTKEEFVELELIKEKFITTYDGGGTFVNVGLMNDKEQRIYFLSCNPNYYTDSESDEEMYAKRKKIERDNRIRRNEYQFLNSSYR